MEKKYIIPNLTQNHPFRQWQIWKIPQTDWTIQGYSRSGDKTFFYIPQASIALDAGLVEGNQANFVFITHAHTDHSADIEYMASKENVQMFMPAPILPYVETYLRARRNLNHVGAYDESRRGKMQLVGVEKDQKFYWGEQDKYEVHVVACTHSVPCVGYAFAEKRKRLKAEYETIKQAMIAEGKAQEFGKFIGQKRKEEEVDEVYYQPLFAFLGDTTTDVFTENPILLTYPVIITECTFLLPEHLAYAEERKHTHWERLKPIVVANPHIQFVLIHFSLRYTDKEIFDFFEKELGDIENVLLWLSVEPYLSPQHQKKERQL
jgi:ribonuclease Z